jgi:hypothetical protein
MLAEKDLGSRPDRLTGSLARIAHDCRGGVRGGCLCAEAISTDVLEGESMVAAARKHNKVVQVGTQRKSTPHLIEAKKQVIDAGLLGKIGQVDYVLLLSHACER